ncbi:hypothetical protein F4859DRAFT_388734 [Xylaria cf. heliscus]|nr:hypothetical protein F4859DRAFT_388734 [Xylaria cf. heliscus]
MQSSLITAVAFMAVTGITQLTTCYTNNCTTVNITAPSSAVILTNTPAPYEQLLTKRAIGTGIIIVAEGDHSHISRVVLAWIIIGALSAFFAIVALIVCVNWKRPCGWMPTKTSKGVRDLEHGFMRHEERNANPGVEAAQSGGHPFMNKNMIGGKH